MTLNVLEGHSPIANLFRCYISYVVRRAVPLQYIRGVFGERCEYATPLYSVHVMILLHKLCLALAFPDENGSADLINLALTDGAPGWQQAICPAFVYSRLIPKTCRRRPRGI